MSRAKYYNITRKNGRISSTGADEIADEIMIDAFNEVSRSFVPFKKQELIKRVAYKMFDHQRKFLNQGWVCINYKKLEPVEKFYYEIQDSLMEIIKITPKKD